MTVSPTANLDRFALAGRATRGSLGMGRAWRGQGPQSMNCQSFRSLNLLHAPCTVCTRVQCTPHSVSIECKVDRCNVHRTTSSAGVMYTAQCFIECKV